MAAWKIMDLIESLKGKLDQELFELAHRLLTSLEWKIRAEKYHTQLAEQAFFEHFGDSAITTSEAVRLLLISNEDGAKFYYSQSVREFNLVAAISVSHTIPELFSQLIAVVFFPNKFNVQDVRINKIASQLPEGELKSKVNEITQSREYEYIKAFTNMSKHISLVIPEYHISFREDEYHGIRFKEFDYKSQRYQSKRDEDLLNDLRTMRKRFIELGILISHQIIC